MAVVEVEVPVVEAAVDVVAEEADAVVAVVAVDAEVAEDMTQRLILYV